MDAHLVRCPSCQGVASREVLDGGIMPRPAGLPLPRWTCDYCAGAGEVTVQRAAAFEEALDAEFPGWREGPAPEVERTRRVLGTVLSDS